MKSILSPSSNGLGHRVLIPKIGGSNPPGDTKKVNFKEVSRLFFFEEWFVYDKPVNWFS